MKRVSLWLIAFLLWVGGATPAVAYVGPGAGLSLLGALWGLLIAVGAAIGFVVLWPLRRFLKNRQAAKAPQDEGDSNPEMVSQPPSS